MDGRSYCPLHARCVQQVIAPRLGLCTLDGWNDDVVAVYQLAPMSDACEICQSLNFPEERVLRGHFTICCSNGKTSDLPPFEDPGPVFNVICHGSLMSHESSQW